ncbi:SUMF1/EgtB/PvdO family nonheme iron enzyme [Pontibacter roseus]|uniref:SUMF1/EgtB/PvdO family nonheme iron enzyme n=1 Tax=Pontibacter roseus TaxID=336989 RepID=UPI00036E17C0|nr:SUMF1/EgtB/PvdO family nonheme iron enzyme [Pontibacter roseus]
MPLIYLLSLYLLLMSSFPAAPAKDALPVPPGGIRLQENLYLDETEVSNIHWWEYMHHLQKDSSLAQYKAAMPDTTVWDKVDVTGHMKKNYFRSPGYRFFPVVGVSYEQMLNYCRWRSAAATAAFNSNPKNKKKYKLQGQEVVFRYRLPTEAEWKMAAEQSRNTRLLTRKLATAPAAYSIIDSLGNSRPDKQKALEKYLSQHADTALNCLKKFEPGLYYGLLEPEKTYPNPQRKAVVLYGRYPHLIGNVAEMTQQKGIAKGGSWAHRLEQVSVEKVNSYEAPTAWLGARCIGEVYLVPQAKAQQ